MLWTFFDEKSFFFFLLIKYIYSFLFVRISYFAMIQAF